MWKPFVVAVAAASAAAAARPAKPHIVMVVADDYGWNEIGYNQNNKSSANPEGKPTTNGFIRTPTLDTLAKEGVTLQNYYVQPVCSPTRGTIMTGRYCSHTGIGPDVIYPTHPYGMPGKEVFLSELLKQNGYTTHAIGKWHLGLCDKRFTPTFRGFDTYFGYLLGAEDYYQHSRMGYLDLRNGSTPDVFPDATRAFDGQYSANIFTSEAERIIARHDSSVPLFLYFPLQSVHDPLEAPQYLVDEYSSIIPHDTAYGKDRLKKAGMVSSMDGAVANLTRALQANGMYDDTVLVFTTDNGAPLPAGNNYPLRGHKGTTWEGGVRGVAFVRGTNSDLAPLPKGTWSEALMHSSDWLPTLVRGVVGGNTSACQPLDGHDQWRVLQGVANTTRDSVVHNVPAAGQGLTGGAVRKGDYKLLVEGMQTTVGAVQTPPPEMPQPTGDVVPKPFTYNGTTVYLFNVKTDPTESENLAGTNSRVLQEMVDFYTAYQATAVPDLALTHGKNDPTASPKHRPDQAWGPFIGSTECKFSE